MQKESTRDGEFDRCISLSAYTTEKFIPAIMLHMSIDLAKSRTIVMQSHINVDINIFTFTHLLCYFKKTKTLHRVFKP